MKRMLCVTAGLIAVLAFPRLAWAQPAHAANSPKAEIHLSQPLAVGAALLKAGDYKVQCVKSDGKDYLVITSADDGKEMARVPCEPEQLDTRIAVSEMRTVNRPDGTSALSSMRIKGEMVAHRVVTD